MHPTIPRPFAMQVRGHQQICWQFDSARKPNLINQAFSVPELGRTRKRRSGGERPPRQGLARCGQAVPPSLGPPVARSLRLSKFLKSRTRHSGSVPTPSVAVYFRMLPSLCQNQGIVHQENMSAYLLPLHAFMHACTRTKMGGEWCEQTGVHPEDHTSVCIARTQICMHVRFATNDNTTTPCDIWRNVTHYPSDCQHAMDNML